MLKRLPFFAAFLLLIPSAQAQATRDRPLAKAAPLKLQAQITRVERGLSTPVVVKGSPDQKMTLTERMAFYQVPAVSIALINNGQVEWARAYGLADVASRRSATVKTLFQAGSISKAVSAIGALRLVEQSKLSLDEDANRQLASWKIPENEFTRNRAVSLRMLLNHGAGTTVHGFDGYALGQRLPTLLQVLDGASPANSGPVRVDHLPGSAWSYSGGGYSIIQLMMIEASGQPFDRYMKAAVLDRLGMAQSTFVVPLPRTWRDLAATAYDGNGKAVAGQWHNYPESAAAGLWSTPSDLARVVIAVQQAEGGRSDKILSQRTASSMLTRGLGEYGLGFFVENLGDRTSFSHEGGTEGYRSQLYGYTRAGQGVVIMTNSNNGAALINEILCSIAAEYAWPEFKVVEKVSIPADLTINSHLVGDYRLLDKTAYIITEGDHLYFQSELLGHKRMELFPESKTKFFMTAQDMSIRVEHEADGRVAGFTLVRGANTYTAKRIG